MISTIQWRILYRTPGVPGSGYLSLEERITGFYDSIRYSPNPNHATEEYGWAARGPEDVEARCRIIQFGNPVSGVSPRIFGNPRVRREVEGVAPAGRSARHTLSLFTAD